MKPELLPRAVGIGPQTTGAGAAILARHQVTAGVANETLIAVARTAVRGFRQLAIGSGCGLEGTEGCIRNSHTVARVSALRIRWTERRPCRAVPRMINIAVTTTDDLIAITELDEVPRSGPSAPWVRILRLRAEGKRSLWRVLTKTDPAIRTYPLETTTLGTATDRNHIAIAVVRFP